MSESITVFAPATVANVACGFDVLGFALQDLGDEITIKPSSDKGLHISGIEGSVLPTDPKKNVATVAAQAMVDSLPDHGHDFGFDLFIKKMVKPGSGLGSSASSASAAVFGINEYLGRPFTKLQLVQFAGAGEKAASGKVHYDNVAASIYGGFTLVRSVDPLDIVPLDFPKDLIAVVAHPQVELKTADAKKILKEEVSLADAITQWANLSGFTAGLFKKDYDLIGRSMSDVIAEPARSLLIPLYNDVKQAVKDAGALGCNIAGSGPSVFSFCQGIKSANEVQAAMQKVYGASDLDVQFHISAINPSGARIIKK